MHFIAECAALAAVLADCREVSDQKTSVVVLGFTKLSLSGNTLTLEATDLRISMRTALTVDGRGDGTALLNTQRIAEIIKALPSGAQIEIAPDTTNPDAAGFILKSGRSRYRLPSLDERMWPEFPAVEEGAALPLAAADLKRLLGKTAAFVGSDVTKLMLYGHLFARKGNKIRVVGTNGMIMAVVDMDAPEGTPEFDDVLIAPETARIALRLVDGDVEMRISPEKVSFAWGQSLLISRLVDATFPNYEQLIPKKHEASIVVNATEARDAVRRAAMISDDALYNGSKAVRISAGDDLLTIAAAGTNGEEGEEVVSGVCQAGGVWGFNARNLLIVFEAGAGDSVTMEMGGTLEPILLRLDSDPGVQIVAAPMTLRGEG